MAHHDSDEGVWLITYKKATGKLHIEYDSELYYIPAFGQASHS